VITVPLERIGFACGRTPAAAPVQQKTQEGTTARSAMVAGSAPPPGRPAVSSGDRVRGLGRSGRASCALSGKAEGKQARGPHQPALTRPADHWSANTTGNSPL
jgi:hypothetical protein